MQLDSSMANYQNRLISQPIRLAVDLTAMSAACTIHSGDVAAIAERIDIAREMFNAVLTEHSQPVLCLLCSTGTHTSDSAGERVAGISTAV